MRIFFLLFIFSVTAVQADMLRPFNDGESENAESYFDDTRAEGEEEPFVVEEPPLSLPATAPVTELSEDSLTDKQHAFYWHSFNWMMEWGQNEEIKAFENSEKTLHITYHVGDRFLTKRHRLCRPYALKLARRHAHLRRSGIACQVESERWCRLREGKHAECRSAGPDEWDNVTNRLEIKQRNLSINTDRILDDLGF